MSLSTAISYLAEGVLLHHSLGVPAEIRISRLRDRPTVQVEQPFLNKIFRIENAQRIIY